MLGAIFHPRALTIVTIDLLGRLRQHRGLLIEQTRRELVEQHAGQVFGSLWSLLNPLFLMLIYVFVFTFVFQTRIGGTLELPLDFTSYILSGLSPWLAIVQAINKSTNSLVSNSNLIKQVVFPIEVLPVKMALSSVAPLLVMVGVYFIYTIIFQHHVFETQLLFPLLLVIYVLWTVGIGFIFASLTVFIRDVREIVQLIMVSGVFVLPVIYLPEWVPSLFKPILYINPFSYVIWCFQDALYFGRFEHPWAWPVAIFGGMLVFMVGARVFRGLKPFFGDAL